jgi:hypothetical protein
MKCICHALHWPFTPKLQTLRTGCISDYVEESNAGIGLTLFATTFDDTEMVETDGASTAAASA